MKVAEKQEAIRLRKAGCSIKEICRRVNVAKSSVSFWVRDIKLTSEQIAELESRVACSRQSFSYLSQCGGANTNKTDAEKRHKRYREMGMARAKVDEFFRLICALYWGEGSKSVRRNVLEISNSDPSLLNVFVKWLILNGYGDLISITVRYHAENGMSVDDLRAWWMERIPGLRERHFRAFTRCTINRASQGKNIGKLPYGTASVQVCRTELLCTVLGGIEYLRSQGDW